jgi:hypothetical protein
MRFHIFIILSILFFSSCGGHKFTANDARDAITSGPQSILEKEDIDVVYVTQISKATVVAESRVKTAFLLKKVDEEWVIQEMRIGHGQWEKIDDLMLALNRVKTEETHVCLDSIADSIRKYKEANGSLPPFKDYVDLSDILAPEYMESLIRLDSWRNPLRATLMDSNAILVVSAGPDGRFSTDDDITITITP